MNTNTLASEGQEPKIKVMLELLTTKPPDVLVKKKNFNFVLETIKYQPILVGLSGVLNMPLRFYEFKDYMSISLKLTWLAS